MKPKYWWIKERHNPQLGVYYVAIGRLRIAAAKGLRNLCTATTSCIAMIPLRHMRLSLQNCGPRVSEYMACDGEPLRDGEA